MSDQAEKGGSFQFLGGNITGKFLEVKEDFLSKKSFYLVTVPTIGLLASLAVKGCLKVHHKHFGLFRGCAASKLCSHFTYQ